MKASTAAVWIAGGLLVATVALTGIVFLVMPVATRQWSALGMLAWITLAGTATAAAQARAGEGRFGRRALAMTAMHGWVALQGCAVAWGLTIFGNSALFTMLAPVTLPSALRTLATGGQQPYLGSPRTILFTISGIAVAHLLYFFGRISPATGLYLVVLGVVSFLAARKASRRAPFSVAAGRVRH